MWGYKVLILKTRRTRLNPEDVVIDIHQIIAPDGTVVIDRKSVESFLSPYVKAYVDETHKAIKGKQGHYTRVLKQDTNDYILNRIIEILDLNFTCKTYEAKKSNTREKEKNKKIRTIKFPLGDREYTLNEEQIYEVGTLWINEEKNYTKIFDAKEYCELDIEPIEFINCLHTVLGFENSIQINQLFKTEIDQSNSFLNEMSMEQNQKLNMEKPEKVDNKEEIIEEQKEIEQEYACIPQQDDYFTSFIQQGEFNPNQSNPIQEYPIQDPVQEYLIQTNPSQPILMFTETLIPTTFPNVYYLLDSDGNLKKVFFDGQNYYLLPDNEPSQ